MRAVFCFVPALAAALVSSASAQELTNKGILVNQILARTRMFTYEKGDLMHVTVRQPAGVKGLAISLHAEFKGDAGKWQPVPPPTTPIGPAYASPHYGGLRDYVELATAAHAVDQNVALFIPFNGFALQPGKDYDLRYVVRLWDEADKEMSRLELEPHRVHVAKESDGIVVSIIDAGACGFLAGASGKAGNHPAGIVRFFDAKTGKWMCPEGKSAANAGTAQR